MFFFIDSIILKLHKIQKVYFEVFFYKNIHAYLSNTIQVTEKTPTLSIYTDMCIHAKLHNNLICLNEFFSLLCFQKLD